MKSFFSFSFAVGLLLSITSFAQSQPTAGSNVLVQGVVFDTLTNQPIPFVTVQVVGTGKTALVNREGHYRLLLPKGRNELKYSHVGYLSKVTVVIAGDTSSVCNAYLQPTVPSSLRDNSL